MAALPVYTAGVTRFPPRPGTLTIYEAPIGQAAVRKTGTELTIVASSYLAVEALQAGEELERRGIDVDVVDLRTIKPLDPNAIVASVRKTGRLLVVDGGWTSFGVSAEVAAVAAERACDALKGPVRRLVLPDAPTPASRSLEQAYYRHARDILNAACGMLGREHTGKEAVQE